MVLPLRHSTPTDPLGVKAGSQKSQTPDQWKLSLFARGRGLEAPALFSSRQILTVPVTTTHGDHAGGAEFVQATIGGGSKGHHRLRIQQGVRWMQPNPTVGVGIREPFVAKPSNLNEAKQNMRVEFRIIVFH